MIVGALFFTCFLWNSRQNGCPSRLTRLPALIQREITRKGPFLRAHWYGREEDSGDSNHRDHYAASRPSVQHYLAVVRTCLWPVD